MTVLAQDLEQELCSVLSSVTSLFLDAIHLEVNVHAIVTLDGQDIHSQNSFEHVEHVAYENLHEVLARPIFEQLTEVTIAIKSRKTLKGTKHLENLRHYLWILFEPWCSRGVAKLVRQHLGIIGYRTNTEIRLLLVRRCLTLPLRGGNTLVLSNQAG